MEAPAHGSLYVSYVGTPCALAPNRPRDRAEHAPAPNGHHDLAEDGRPSHRIDYHQRIVDWLERWIERWIEQPIKTR